MKNTILYLITFLTVIGMNQKLLSQNKNIEITYKHNTDKSVDITYTKELPGSYYIKLDFKNLNNSNSKGYKGVVKYSSGHLIRLTPIDDTKKITFSYNYSIVRGDPNPKIDKPFNYVLPFKKGKSIKIIESTNLKEKYFDGEKDSNWKSYIVNSISADTIYSMRKGIVIEIKAEYETDSLNAYKYTSRMNRIHIEHKDGTYSRYIGFNKKSIFVTLGQTIYPQTKLGVLDIFNNSIYRLYFDVSYLKEVNFDSNKRLLSSKSRMGNITPFFYSSNGPIILKNNNEYSVEIDEAILLKEFTRREKKRYKKSTEPFK